MPILVKKPSKYTQNINIMSPRAFFDLVAMMRKYQKEYFRTRNYTILAKARNIELAIDKEIERVNKIINEPELQFNENNV